LSGLSASGDYEGSSHDQSYREFSYCMTGIEHALSSQTVWDKSTRCAIVDILRYFYITTGQKQLLSTPVEPGADRDKYARASLHHHTSHHNYAIRHSNGRFSGHLINRLRCKRSFPCPLALSVKGAPRENSYGVERGMCAIAFASTSVASIAANVEKQ
jgi:hypothetical protein